jgi:DNA-binding response OmpR family regulator
MDKKTKILIIDDEKSFSGLVKLSLEASGGYDVQVENQGSKGFAAARAFMPDLILLDVVMPDASGSQVASQLKDNPSTKNIPIVFLTALVSEGEVSSQGGVIGGYPFIAKPVTMARLIDCIQANLPR